MSTRERAQGTLKTKQKHVNKEIKETIESEDRKLLKIDNGEFDPGSG